MSDGGELVGTIDDLELIVQPGQWRVILTPASKRFSLAGLKNASKEPILLVCTDERGELARVDTQALLGPGEGRDCFPREPLEGARFVLAWCEREPVTLTCKKAHFGA